MILFLEVIDYFFVDYIECINELNSKYENLFFRQNSLKKDINPLFVIDCGDLVRSLILSCIPNLNESTAFWHRSAVRKDLFLITGHVNGIIRIWDVNTGN